MDIPNKIIAALVLAVAMWLGYGAWAKHQQAIGAKPYIAAIEQQKSDAGKLLAVETEKARAATQALVDFKRNQEKVDATNKSTVEGLAVQLRAAAGPAKRLRDPNATERRAGGADAKGGGSAGAGGGADDAAETGGLFSAGATELLQRLTQEADIINVAYASCRPDAFNLREVLK